jgi:hypothetical protein
MKQETVVNSEQVKGEHGVEKWMGALMILTGAIFLMGTSGITLAGHSPSMLMGLLPIFWIGELANRRYKEDGRFTRRVLSIAVFAVLPFAYIAPIALGYSVSGLWPLGIMAVGVSFILFRGSK